MHLYHMSPTETRQWHNNADTKRGPARDLIRGHAKRQARAENAAQSMVCEFGDMDGAQPLETVNL